MDGNKAMTVPSPGPAPAALTRKSELAGFPQPYDFAWPILRALHRLGGQSTNRAELQEMAFAYMALTAEQLAVLKPDHTQTEASNRAAWAMTYLKWARLVEDPRDGGYRLTRQGRELFADNAMVDDVTRRAYVMGAVNGAKRTYEGIVTGRIRTE